MAIGLLSVSADRVFSQLRRNVTLQKGQWLSSRCPKRTALRANRGKPAVLADIVAHRAAIAGSNAIIDEGLDMVEAALALVAGKVDA